jgi:hypothetical protein
MAHAKAPQLSLNSVFALLPSGAIMAAGTNALLNVCDADKVCCGFKPSAADPHRKLLRSESDANHPLFDVKAVVGH